MRRFNACALEKVNNFTLTAKDFDYESAHQSLAYFDTLIVDTSLALGKCLQVLGA